MPHATLIKFGYPETLLREGRHWALLVRPQQPTLGSLVLCSTSDATAYGDLPVEAFVEQREMIAFAEALLRDAVAFERINWLMLMMIDRHVHFHVVPRYSGTRSLAKMTMGDSGWPGMANLSHSEAATPELILELRGRANPS